MGEFIARYWLIFGIALLGLVSFALRTFIKQAVEKSVAARFESQLEKEKSELRVKGKR
ncbi:hypothetical protein VXM50_22885 [Xanthomonas citri pv. citri]